MVKSNLIDIQHESEIKGYTFFRKFWMVDQNMGMRVDYFLCDEIFFKERVLKFELLPTTASSDHVPSVLTLNANVFTHIELGLERPPYILNAPHLQTRPSSPNMRALVYEARSPLQRSWVAYLRT